MINKDMTKSEAMHSSEKMEKLFPWFYEMGGTEEELNAGLSQAPDPVWAELMADALNHLQESMDQQIPVDFPLYTEEEMKEHPDCRETRLLFFPGKPGMPYVLICPGGAYMMVAAYGEGLAAAHEVSKSGYNTFILRYRAGQKGVLKKALHDVYRAVKTIESLSEQLQIDVTHYAVMGFSAGAHLAGMWASKDGYERYHMRKPEALLLGYPAGSTDAFYDNLLHSDDGQTRWLANEYLSNILGENYTEEMVHQVSLEHCIDEEYPATFIIQCEDDTMAPISGTCQIIDALKALEIPVQFEPVEVGGHGFSVGLHMGAQGWIERALEFWR